MQRKEQKFSASLREVLGIEFDDRIDLRGEYGINDNTISVDTLINLPDPAPDRYVLLFREEFEMDVELVSDLLRIGSVSDLGNALDEADLTGASRDESIENMIESILRNNVAIVHDDDFDIDDINDLDQYYVDNPEMIPDEDKVIVDHEGRFASLSAGENILDTDVYSFIRHQIIAISRFGYVPAIGVNTEYRAPVFASAISAMMESVNKRATEAIVTISSVDAEGEPNSMSSTVSIDNEQTVIWDNAFVAAAFTDIRVLGLISTIQVRCFDPIDTAEVMDPSGSGEKMIVPRKSIGGWIIDQNDPHYWVGLSDSTIGHAHSVDAETGDIIVPEEGIEYVSVPTIRRTMD